MKPASFYFNPRGAGSSVFLGPTEAELMELAWSQEELTVKKALQCLDSDTPRAYTTVMTVLSRLATKGLLTRHRQGRVFVYRPAVERSAWLNNRVRTILSTLDTNFPRSIDSLR